MKANDNVVKYNIDILVTSYYKHMHINTITL